MSPPSVLVRERDAGPAPAVVDNDAPPRNTNIETDVLADPVVPDWGNLALPDTWPDQLRLTRPKDLWRLVRALLGKRKRVTIPAEMPGADALPKYVLQEFHGLPNGNYSKRFTEGYVNTFDRMMLGRMHQARKRMASYLAGCQSVLDVGTAGGGTAAVLQRHGIPDVWAIDPSPYLLQHAARRHPDVRFVQGLAEQLPFRNQRFDGVTVCFVLHEIPPKQVQRLLVELRRVIKPGGLLAICEPGPAQLEHSAWTLLKREGFAGLYFRWLARHAHEPFVRSWHRLDVNRLLNEAGFEPGTDEQTFPVRDIYARARS